MSVRNAPLVAAGRKKLAGGPHEARGPRVEDPRTRVFKLFGKTFGLTIQKIYL